MKHIIIDTNVVHLDYMLNKSRIMALCSTCDSLDHVVFMPDVVIDELVKQYREEIQGYAEQYNSALHQLTRRNAPVANNPLDPVVLTSKYEDSLRARIAQLRIKIISYPQTAHKEMVARELNKKKPFKDSKKGYRDSLIWDSIIEHCLRYRKDAVMFLSENSDDFASKDKKTLHQDLIEDCCTKGIDPSQIELVTAVHRFIDEEIVNKSKKLEELLFLLQQTDLLGDIDLMKEVEKYINVDNLDTYINGDAYGESVVYVPGYYENPVIAGISTNSITFDSIHEISKTEILVRCSVEVELDLDVFIYHGDLALIDDDMLPYIFDYEWNDHYAAASDSTTFKLQLNIVCDNELKEIQSIDDQLIAVDYKTGYHFDVLL